jgi:chemosensory pili system protein ChpA (sensor histidine kinase/response regulator)
MLDLTENIIAAAQAAARSGDPGRVAACSRSRLRASERSMEFDPLELDRFTRLQEVTRMMAESVNDVATVQHERCCATSRHAGAAVAAQARLSTRTVSMRLLGARMVPFESIRRSPAPRGAPGRQGHRKVSANLDIAGMATRPSLTAPCWTRMGAPLEHLLRNAIAHGLESAGKRRVPPASRCDRPDHALASPRKATRSSSRSPTTAPVSNLERDPPSRPRHRGLLGAG